VTRDRGFGIADPTHFGSRIGGFEEIRVLLDELRVGEWNSHEAS